MAVLEEVGCPWNLEVFRCHTKNTFLHFSDQKASLFESPRGHRTRQRRAVSDVTDGGPKLVPISPLLAAAAAPGEAPSLVPVDEAADHRPKWINDIIVKDLDESPLALSPDAAARHLPDFLNDDSVDDDAQGTSRYPPMTPSPLLHASMPPDCISFRDSFFGSEVCSWELGPTLCGEGAREFSGWKDGHEESWAVAEASYHNSYWDQASGEGYPAWDMQLWDQNGCSDFGADASLWDSNPNNTWDEDNVADDSTTRGGILETPEKSRKYKGDMQKKDKYEVAEKDGNDARPCDMSGTETTVMLRNIPNKFMPDALAKQLSHEWKGMFDFIYLPIDFKNKCNVGYGFVNFRTAELCSTFVQSFNGVEVRKCLPGFNSRKVVEVTPARVQGLQDNVRRLRNSPVMTQLMDNPDWLPLLFDDDGESLPFPAPDQPLAPVRPRGGRHRDVQK